LHRLALALRIRFIKLPRPAFILSVVVAAVLTVGGLGAVLLPRIVDSQIVRENVSAELAKRFAALTSNVPFLAIVEGRNWLRIGEIGWWRAILAVILYGLFLHFHRNLFGVSPLPL